MSTVVGGGVEAKVRQLPGAYRNLGLSTVMGGGVDAKVLQSWEATKISARTPQSGEQELTGSRPIGGHHLSV